MSRKQSKVSFVPQVGSQSRSRSFRISYPNWCALRYEGRDLIIRKMLADSGIEPLPPTDSNA
jgi:hypothetical protein